MSTANISDNKTSEDVEKPLETPMAQDSDETHLSGNDSTPERHQREIEEKMEKIVDDIMEEIEGDEEEDESLPEVLEEKTEPVVSESAVAGSLNPESKAPPEKPETKDSEPDNLFDGQPFCPCTELRQLPDDPTYIAHEEEYVKIWTASENGKPNLYSRMVAKNEGKDPFVIMDGPPFVSGNLHPGHAAVSSTKSAEFNYNIMKGRYCPFKMGYDCHGLPIENLVCKENGLDSLEKIHDIGLASFNQLCEDTITKYSTSWTPLFERLGRFSDFDNVYMTRDRDFMESCIWIFSELYKKDLVYKGNKVMAYSYACQTPLSNFEASQNYQEKETKSIYVGFEIEYDNDEDDEVTADDAKEYLVAWTTTPWTLPANLALCVNQNIDYVKVRLQDGDTDDIYVVGKNSVRNLFGKKAKLEIVEECKGSDLVGLTYKPLFSYMAKVDEEKSRNRTYRVLADNYVTEQDIGTAIVHQAPAFGDDDFRVCSANGLVDNVTVSDYCPLDESGNYTDTVPDYAGRLVFDCEDDIRAHLKETGHLFKTQSYRHNYPYCWRTDTPLIYRTTESYYIKVTALKDRLVELNKTVSWYPKEIGENRFHQWLSNAKDWAVSRFRFYGTPLPLWVAEDGDTICVGSIQELEELTGETVENLHPEYVNDLVIEKDGKVYKRVPDIFDCWFESGAVPMAQMHYPFNPESKVLESREFLSDFICEGMDQTRGWFYTLLVLSAAIVDKAPYRNVMCTGMILDKNGQKFSKKLGNFVDPTVTIDQFGSDILRTYFIDSPLMHADSLKFDERFIDKLKKRFIPYINGVKFWIEHTLNYTKQQNLKKLTILELTEDDLTNIMDKWIVSRTDDLVQTVNQHMESYALGKAIDTMLDYIDDLTNWYIKFNRDRLKGNEGTEDWETSSKVLYNVLMTYCRLWAPFTPFLSEHVYQHLNPCSEKYREIDSVLLTDYPEPSEIKVDHESLKLMRDLQRICQMVRNMRDRTDKHCKVVVPLRGCTIYHDDPEYLKVLETYVSVIQSECNYFDVKFETLQENVTVSVVPDRKAIGIKFRKESKAVIKLIESRAEDTAFMMKVYEGKEEFRYCSDNYDEPMDQQYYRLTRVPKQTIGTDTVMSMIDQDLMVSIDHTYDQDIHLVYQHKRIHSAVQSIRKVMDLRPWNKVTVVLDEKYANIETKRELTDAFNNASVLVASYDQNGDDKYATMLGLCEDDVHKIYSENFEWEGFQDESNLCGKLTVHFRKETQ